MPATEVDLSGYRTFTLCNARFYMGILFLASVCGRLGRGQSRNSGRLMAQGIKSGVVS